MDTNNPFETFQHTAFRLEGLPEYIVPDEKESFSHFLKTGAARPTDIDWASLVAKNTSEGKKMERLRLLSEKLTDYERFELQIYSGPASGEVIRTAPRKDYQEKYQYDFWFFDDEWIAQIYYEPDGTFVKFDVRRATQPEKDMFMYWYGVFEYAKPLRQVPFVSNTPDNTHCLQAAYMSVAKLFDPNFSIPMDEWADLTGYEERKGTWANAGLVWFNEHGYEVRHIESFDYKEFMKRPREYMLEFNGEEAGTWGYEHTNIPAEIERMKKLLDTDIIEHREPTFDDLKQFIDEGYLVRVTVNSNRLDKKEGYVGHAITVTAYNEKYITFHDPGRPPIPNRQATFGEFETAWSDSNPNLKELDAIRIKK